MKQPKLIEEGQTLQARSICDYDCIFSCKVIKRNKSMVTVYIQDSIRKCKVRVDADGYEYVMALGTHSMAPAFKPIN